MSLPTNESIYNLIPTAIPPRPKPPRHKSKFAGTVRMEAKQDKTTSRTMGPAKVEINSPKDFLKKHSKEVKLPEKPRGHEAVQRRPLVSSPPQLGAKCNKNFITTNAVNNIMSVPRQPVPKYVDGPGGDSFQLEDSGMFPKYSKKKEYGKVPSYLERRKEEIAEAQEEYDRYVQESLRKGQMEQVSQEERERLLAGLKTNWQDLNQQFQGLSVVTDTIAKRTRKERLEAEMQQLEKDIELVERHRCLYISQPQPNLQHY